MAEEKIAVKIIPTPGTHDVAHNDLVRLSRLTKIPVDKIIERISRGKGITIITAMHPRVQELVEMIRSIGFSVVTGAPPKSSAAPPAGATSPRARALRRAEENEWHVGEVIENLYEVRDIKHGGMGAVYVVHHRRWNVMMAVKSLLKRLQDSEEDRALFLKEAETWIDIGFHPNIAACYYVRTIRDNLRIFIEYVDGGALNHWLVYHQPVGWDLLIDLMVQFCDGLEHAHSKGLVHRDVKPGNCMMTKGGILKVTDFGLTKRSKVVSQSNSESGDPLGSDTMELERESITAAGMGTPGYMAPEMWIPHANVGPSADVYAFGVMFFELCCGRKPFVVKPGERRDRLAYAHVKKAPPAPSTFRKEIPKPIEELILRCLKKRPDERYPSFLAVREDLTAIYEQLYRKRFSRERPDEVRLLSDALNNRAVSLMDLNHEEEAEGALAKALESDPHHPEAVYNRGLLDWIRTGDPTWDVIMLMEEVTKTPEYVGRGAHLLGRCLLTLGDAPKALKACELAVSSDEAAEDRLKPYSIALIGCGKESEAISHLETYLKDFPNDDEAIAWLTGALVRQGRRAEAEERLKSMSSGSEFSRMTLEEITDAFVFMGLSEKMLLKGHSGWVMSVCHCPESNIFLTASRDRTIKVWDAATGEEKRTIPVVGQPPTGLWISPDERLVLLTATQMGAPSKVLDLESGRFVGSQLGHEGVVTAAGFSSDGSHVITVEQKGAVRLWETSKFKVASSFKVPLHTAAAVISADPKNPEILIAGMDRALKRVRLADSHIEPFEPGHADAIASLRMNPSGDRAISAGRDRRVIVWDAGQGKIITVFKVHNEPVTELALNPSMNLAASYDPKNGLKLWDLESGSVVRSFPEGDGEIHALAFTHDGNRLLAGGKDMVVRVWDVRGHHVLPGLALAKIRPVTKQMRSDRKFKAIVERSQRAMKKGAFAKAYRLLRETQNLSGYERSDVVLDLILRMKGHGTRIGIHGGWKRKTFDTASAAMDVAFSSSAINFLTAQADHSIKMWSTKTGDCLKTLKGHTNLVAAIRYSVNGREAVSGGDDRSVRVWDLNTGRNVLTLKGHTESVSSVAYSHDGTHVISGSWDQTVRLWRISDGAAVKTLKGPDDKITSVELVRGSGYAVSAGFEGVIRMWELSSGRIVRELRGHRDRIMCLRISPGGTLLLSVSIDGTARMWDLRKGTCIETLEVSEEGLRAAAFSPDERFFITGGADAVLRLWDARTYQCLREFQGHSKEVTGLDFASNGRVAISSSLDGCAMLWELDWEWAFGDEKTEAETKASQ